MALTFQNNYEWPVWLCLLWYDDSCPTRWRKTGWWYIGHGQDVEVLSGNLRSHYYYFWARAADGAHWSGNGFQFLVTNKQFNVCQNDPLEQSYLVSMREIYTGGADHVPISLS